MKSSAIKGLAIISLFIGACRDSGNNQQAQAKNDTAQAKKEYLPVMDYIRSEINTIDSLPVGILKRTNTGNKVDSAFITPKEFKQLAAQFLSEELKKENFEKSFSESSFPDQTTGLITFTYQATNPAMELKRIDVHISPSLQMDRIRSIYMEKVSSGTDTIVEKKMYWRSGTSFNIITQKTPAGKAASLDQLKVIWDPMNY
jgi:hypothetical protein